jgi:hypothetical protein
MAVLELLTERAPRTIFAPVEAPLRDSDPYGVDMQLALHICYELHYRGFAGVDPGWEWNPALLHLRAQFEYEFLAALQHDLGAVTADVRAADDMDDLRHQAGPHPAQYLRSDGTWTQMQEYFVHRSFYRFRECDPHSFGARQCECPGRLTKQSFGELMIKAGLDANHLGYIDRLPAQSLAMVNLMSLFGLHRAHRGAAAGRLAAAEAAANQSLGMLREGLERISAPKACIDFYRNYAEISTGPERSAYSEMSALIAREPALEPDVVFGIRAQQLVEKRLTEHLVKAWRAGRSSLRRPL